MTCQRLFPIAGRVLLVVCSWGSHPGSPHNSPEVSSRAGNINSSHRFGHLNFQLHIFRRPPEDGQWEGKKPSNTGYSECLTWLFFPIARKIHSQPSFFPGRARRGPKKAAETAGQRQVLPSQLRAGTILRSEKGYLNALYQAESLLLPWDTGWASNRESSLDFQWTDLLGR